MPRRICARNRAAGARRLLYFLGRMGTAIKIPAYRPAQRDSPYCIHEPAMFLTGPVSDEERRGLNTDPYVFGPCFWYTNCRQNRNGRFLRTLAPYSIILFGKEKKAVFLDTVFVVDENGIDTPIPQRLLPRASKQLKRATFCRDDLCQKRGHTFYRGLMVAQSPEFFSFVPGKPCGDSGPTLHDRPLLEPACFGLRGFGTRTARLFQENGRMGRRRLGSSKSIWKKIAQHCINQGFSLIPRIEEPRVEE